MVQRPLYKTNKPNKQRFQYDINHLCIAKDPLQYATNWLGSKNILYLLRLKNVNDKNKDQCSSSIPTQTLKKTHYICFNVFSSIWKCSLSV